MSGKVVQLKRRRKPPGININRRWTTSYDIAQSVLKCLIHIRRCTSYIRQLKRVVKAQRELIDVYKEEYQKATKIIELQQEALNNTEKIIGIIRSNPYITIGE